MANWTARWAADTALSMRSLPSLNVVTPYPVFLLANHSPSYLIEGKRCFLIPRNPCNIVRFTAKDLSDSDRRLVGGSLRAFRTKPPRLSSGGFTSIRVSLLPVSVLQAIGPSAFVFGARIDAETHAVPAFEPLRPFALVCPPAASFYAQTMSLAVLPLAFVAVAARPGINARNFESVMPGAGIFALTLQGSEPFPLHSSIPFSPWDPYKRHDRGLCLPPIHRNNYRHRRNRICLRSRTLKVKRSWAFWCLLHPLFCDRKSAVNSREKTNFLRGVGALCTMPTKRLRPIQFAGGNFVCRFDNYIRRLHEASTSGLPENIRFFTPKKWRETMNKHNADPLRHPQRPSVFNLLHHKSNKPNGTGWGLSLSDETGPLSFYLVISAFLCSETKTNRYSRVHRQLRAGQLSTDN
uniref:Uncharacterized protein n=1 Tax=Romanomermis culicivorax TaxID=13658 RepID=A0A915KAE6_ROMCU